MPPWAAAIFLNSSSRSSGLGAMGPPEVEAQPEMKSPTKRRLSQCFVGLTKVSLSPALAQRHFLLQFLPFPPQVHVHRLGAGAPHLVEEVVRVQDVLAVDAAQHV